MPDQSSRILETRRKDRTGFFACVWMAWTVLGSPAAAARPKTWTLYHAITTLGDTITEPVFIPRGRIQLSLKKDGETASKQTKTITRPVGVKNDEPYLLTIEHEDNVVTDDFIKSLLNDNTLYQLKLIPEDNPNAPPVLATIPACQLRRANFRDELILTLSPNAQVLSLTYMPLVSPLAPSSCSVYLNSDDWKQQYTTFDSRLQLETAVPGMTLKTVLPEYQPPPGLQLLKGPAGDKTTNSAGLGGEPTKPPDSTFTGFMQRYWYILLPMMLLNFMTASPSEEPQQGQQQPQQQPPASPGQISGQQASTGGGSSPTAAAAGEQSDGSARKRRAKRS